MASAYSKEEILDAFFAKKPPTDRVFGIVPCSAKSKDGLQVSLTEQILNLIYQLHLCSMEWSGSWSKSIRKSAESQKLEVNVGTRIGYTSG